MKKLFNSCLLVAVLMPCYLCSTSSFAAPKSCNAHFNYELNNDSTFTSVNFHVPANAPHASFSWTFGDGTTSSQRNPEHMYAATGTYYVCLNVTSSFGNGCSDSFCDSVHVEITCNADFEAEASDTDSLTINFETEDNPFGSYFLWTFGDSDSAFVAAPMHTFDSAGTYYVCFTVTDTDSAGTVLCSSMYCDSVNVGMGEDEDNDRHLIYHNTNIPSIGIYPNPAFENIGVYVHNAEGNNTFIILDSQGKVVVRKQNMENGNHSFNVSNLVPGIYFYEFNLGDTNVGRGKLIIQQ
jgi:PKD repeat protein